MSTIDDRAEPLSKLPGSGRTVLFGTILGVVSSTAGIVCLVIALMIFAFVTHPGIPSWQSMDGFWRFIGFLAYLVIFYAYVALAPATFGGLAIAVLLYLATRARSLGLLVAAILGVVVGLVEGSVTAWIIAPIPDTQGWLPDLPRGPFWNGAIGIVQGLFVSAILYAWFKRTMR